MRQEADGPELLRRFAARLERRVSDALRAAGVAERAGRRVEARRELKWAERLQEAAQGLREGVDGR